MPNLIAILPTEEPYVSITWQVNNFCNYRCSYCNEGNWSGKYKNDGAVAPLLSNLDELIDHYQQLGYVNFKVFFSGGEPTLWKNITPVMKFFKERLDKHVTLGINTNLSRKLSWWEENWFYIDDVVASYHPEFANKENYFEISEFLQTRINYLCLRMMVVEEKFDELLAVGDEVRSRLKNYNLEFVPLLKEMSTGAVPWTYIDPKITEFLNNHGFESKLSVPKPNLSIGISSSEHYDDGTKKILNSNRIVAENRNFFKGWTCNVNESIFIGPSGAMSAASCGQGPVLGNIFTNFSFPKDSIICQKDYCHCGTDILITKKL
jgi:organic radical activating enzyme